MVGGRGSGRTTNKPVESDDGNRENTAAGCVLAPFRVIKNNYQEFRRVKTVDTKKRRNLSYASKKRHARGKKRIQKPSRNVC